MGNDKVHHLRKPIAITGITQALNGTVVLAADGSSVSYAPVAGYSGVDTFTYTIAVSNNGTTNTVVSTFMDPIPVGVTYVPNTTTLNGISVPDLGGTDMPFTVAREIHGPGTPAGQINPGEAAIVAFQVTISATPPARINNMATVLANGGEIRSGISCDQLLAEKTKGQTKVPSLVLGTEPSIAAIHKNYSMIYSSHISWSSASTPTPLELYPALAFDRLFRDEVGKVVGYQRLDRLGQTLEPILLRRRKAEVLRDGTGNISHRLVSGLNITTRSGSQCARSLGG
jgi:uncharacterized repeat protein (TIGR01451 family)